MATLDRHVPCPPGLSHPLRGILIPASLAWMESPGLAASRLFSPRMLWSHCAFLQANLPQEAEGSHEDFSQLLRNFEQWLQVENSKLVRIIAMRTATAEDFRTRETKLQVCSQRKTPFHRVCLKRCLTPGSASKRSTDVARELFLFVYKQWFLNFFGSNILEL